MTSIILFKVLRSLAFAAVTAAIYIGVKYWFGGVNEHHLWLAVTFAILVGFASSFPWRSSPPGDPSGTST